MRRLLNLVLAGAVWCVPVLAQPRPGPRPAGPPGPPSGPGTPRTGQPSQAPKAVPLDVKLRYICKQLELDEKQRAHVEGLFGVLHAELNKTPEELQAQVEQIRELWNEKKAAEASGDTARAAELSERVKNLAPSRAAENEFVSGILPVLNEAQKAKFQKLLKELETATDLSPKPLQVVRLARKCHLSPDQERKLDQLQQEFRAAVAQAGSPPAAQRDEQVNKLISDIAAILDAAQRASFEKDIALLRPDEPTGPPTTQPGAKP